MQISSAFTFPRGQNNEKRAALFARGFLALSGRPQILSAQGQALLREAQAFLSSPQGGSDILIDRLPRVGNLDLRLFVSPFANFSPSEKEEILKLFNNPGKEQGFSNYRILQLSKGCFNQCLICAFEASPQVVHMPYPMILAVAKEISPNILFLTYRGNDPLGYRDEFFGADYGDLVYMLSKMGCNFSEITHGWWPNDGYAIRAAKKIHALGRRIERLSIHLFHKQVLLAGKEILPQVLNSFAQRFRQAIEFLRPKEISVLYLPQGNPNYITVWGKNFMQEWYEREISPGFPPPQELGFYRVIPEGRGQHFFGQGVSYHDKSTIDPPGTNVVFTPSGAVEIEEKAVALPQPEIDLRIARLGPDSWFHGLEIKRREWSFPKRLFIN